MRRGRSVSSEDLNDDKKVELLKDARVAVITTAAGKFSREILEKCDELKLICLTMTGTDSIDLDYTTEKGIIVTNVPHFSTESVAEHVFALSLALARRIMIADKRVRETREERFRVPGFDLKGKTLGIIGFGSVGSRVSEIAKAFGMRILVHTRTPKSVFGVEFVDLEKLLKESDIITLHIPLTEETRNMISASQIKMMKDSVFLINTSRKEVVNQDDLLKALEEQEISGAGLDFFEPSSSLLSLNNVILTHHSAWDTFEAVQRCDKTWVDNVLSFVDGEPQNMVFSE